MENTKKQSAVKVFMALTLFSLISAGAWASNSGQLAETKSAPNAVGDVVLNDGTAVAYENISNMSEEQKANAVAVIFYIGTECSNNGKSRMLGVGLHHAKNVSWNSNNSEELGHKAVSLDKSPDIETIKCNVRAKILSKETKGNKVISVTTNIQYDTDSYVFEGDKDGSDNLERISAFLKKNKLPDDTAEDKNYPAFYFAKNYKDYKFNRNEEKSSKPSTKISIMGISVIGKGDYQTVEASTNVGDKFKDGWYLPSIAEMFYLWKNLDKVEKASVACGGDQFKPEWAASQSKNSGKTKRSYPYWTSSQYEPIKIDGENAISIPAGGVGHLAFTLDIVSGTCGSGQKSDPYGVACAIREF